MTNTLAFSFKNLLPRLSDLVKTAQNWLSRKSTHEADFLKWRQALESEPNRNAQIFPIDLYKASHLFSKAFAVYDRVKKTQHLSLNDFRNANELQTSWKNTIAVAKEQNLIMPALVSTGQVIEDTMYRMTHTIAANTARDAVEFFDTKGVARAFRSADFLSKACATQLEVKDHIFPGVQEKRLNTFIELQEILESSVALGNYSSTPFVEMRLREKLQENSQVLNTLQRSNELSQNVESIQFASPTM